MQKLTVFFKQLRLHQLLTALLATVVLFVGTACNSGTVQGARPDNPPVQMGGANNPYKGGGDPNTNYRFSADPKVSKEATKEVIKSQGTKEAPKAQGNRADLPIISTQLIAASNKAQYPGGNELQGRPADEQKQLPLIDMQDFEAAEPGGQIQRESNVGDRIKDRLGSVKEQFDEASEFISDDAKEAKERHDVTTKPLYN